MLICYRTISKRTFRSIWRIGILVKELKTGVIILVPGSRIIAQEAIKRDSKNHIQYSAFFGYDRKRENKNIDGKANIQRLGRFESLVNDFAVTELIIAS